MATLKDNISVLRGATVNYVRFSYQIDINFLFGASPNWKYANLQIEAPFQLKTRDGSYAINQSDIVSLMPVVSLLHATIERVDLTKNYELTLGFDNGAELSVAPIPAHEAWHISGDGMQHIIAQGI